MHFNLMSLNIYNFSYLIKVKYFENIFLTFGVYCDSIPDIINISAVLSSAAVFSGVLYCIFTFSVYALNSQCSVT